MKGEEFIAFAGKIVVLHREEAACRTVIGRAYYGAFHVVLALFSKYGITADANHGHLWSDLLSSDHAIGEEIGRLLQELYSNRIVADYRLEQPETLPISFAIRCVENAQRIVSLVESLAEQLKTDKIRHKFVNALAAQRTLTGRRP